MMSSINGKWVIGSVLCKIANHFILPMARLTRMRAFAIFFVFCTSFVDICSKPLLGGGITKLAKCLMSSSLIVKPLSARMTSYGLIRSQNPSANVMCLSDALPPHTFDRYVIVPFGAIPIKTLTVLCFL